MELLNFIVGFIIGMLIGVGGWYQWSRVNSRKEDVVLLSSEEKTEWRKLAACPHCGGRHLANCPYIQEMVFYEGGVNIQRVTYFKERMDILAEGIIWPGDIEE